MTFRQILNLLWHRRLLIAAVVIIAFAVAGVIIQREAPLYSSSTMVRFSASATDASLSGQIGSIPVDFDPETITSPTVLDSAAKLSGDRPHALLDQVTVTTEQGTRTSRVTISATGPTPDSAKKRTQAVAKAYGSYLDGQVKTAINALQTQKATATTEAESYQAQVSLAPSNSVAQANLSSALANLAALNTQITKVQTAGPPITQLQPALTGTRVGATPLVILAIALLTGLIAGIGLALIRDQFDNRLRGEAEVESLTGMPSLGELSLDKKVARRRERLPAAERARTALSEGLRALRTTLQVLLAPSGALIILTSVEPGDGKTFISANLAVTWARARKRVILVGGDLRRPALGEYFGDDAEGDGLTELLHAAASTGVTPTPADVTGLLVDSEYPGLRILPSGSEPTDPADLLADSALGEILASLREVSDVVIIDSPPTLALTDASILAAHADGVVVISTVERTDRASLVESIHTLETNGANILGIVANRSRRRLPKTYGAYYGTAGARGRGRSDRSAARSEGARPARGGTDRVGRVEEPAWDADNEDEADVATPEGDQEPESSDAISEDSTSEEPESSDAISDDSTSEEPESSDAISDDSTSEEPGAEPAATPDARAARAPRVSTPGGEEVASTMTAEDPTSTVTPDRPAGERASILFVCTANRCRSPFAEAIARRLGDERQVRFSSAGLISGGQPVPGTGLVVAAELGLPLADHLSRRVDESTLPTWDIILAMSREHLREVVASDASVWPRSFTLRQFGRWVQRNPPARHVRLGPWLDIAAADRSRYDAIGAEPDDDIADPLHLPAPEWRRMAGLLDSEIAGVLSALGVARFTGRG